MSIATGTEGERYMLRISPTATLATSLRQCENDVTVKCASTGPAEWNLPQEAKEEQSAGDQEEMEAHLRFLTMDLEMEGLDLESCFTLGEDIPGAEAGEGATPRLSLRAELAKARRGKLAENMKKSSSESAFQETPPKDATFAHSSKETAAEPSPGETSIEPPEYVLSSADRMQVDSLLLPEPFEPAEEEMLIRDRDLSSFQNAPGDAGRFVEEERNLSPEHVSRQKMKVSTSQADEVLVNMWSEREPSTREECTADTLLQTPESMNNKDKAKETDAPEASKDKQEYRETDLSCGRLRNGEPEIPSAVKGVCQPPKRTHKSTASRRKSESIKNNDARQGSTVVKTETERNSDGSAACENGAKKARVTDDDADPPKVLKIKQVGMLRVKRKPETGSDRSGQNRMNLNTRAEPSNVETPAKAIEQSGADQHPEVIDIDDSPSPSGRKQKASQVARKPETRSDRKKRTREAPEQSAAFAKLDTESATAKKRRRMKVIKKQPSADADHDGQAATPSGEIRSTDRGTGAKERVITEETPGVGRSEPANSMQNDTQALVLTAVKPPVIKGSRIQRKRGVYVGQ